MDKSIGKKLNSELLVPRSIPPTLHALSYLVVFFILITLTLWELVFLPMNICNARKAANKRLVSALTSSDDLFAAQRASSQFLHLSSLPESRSCRNLIMSDSRIEQSIPDSRIDAVVLYIVSALGATKKTFIEIDSSRAKGQMYGASSLVRYGWSGVVMHEKWTAYEACRQHYEPIQKSLLALDLNLEVIDSGNITDVGRLNTILRNTKLVGGIDVMMMFAGGGRDLMLFSHIHYSIVRPRIFILFYQAYWGITDRSRTGAGQVDADGRERLFTGGSLAALIRTAEKTGYRLIWCLQRMPIAVFVRKEIGREFETIEVNRCIHNDKVWKRDAEAMWDAAEQYNWT